MTGWGRQSETRARERLYDLTRLTADWVWETDRDGRFAVVSPRVMDLLGLLPDELAGRTFADLEEAGADTPQDAEPTALARLLAARRPFRDHCCRLRARHGAARVVLVSALPFYDPDDGSFLGLRGTCRDVSDEAATRATLADQTALHRAVIDAVPCPVVCRRADGRVDFGNAAFAGLMGRPAEALVGATLFDLLPRPLVERLCLAEADLRAAGDGRRQYVDSLHICGEAGAPVRVAEAAAGGVARPVRVTLTLLPEADGRSGIVVALDLECAGAPAPAATTTTATTATTEPATARVLDWMAG